MAIDFDMCPTMMARKILEYYCKLEDENGKFTFYILIKL